MEIKRDAYLEQLKIRKDNGMIKIITGIRRCGKSFLLFVLFKKYLLESGVDNDHIIEIALDGIENEELRDPKKCYQHIKERVEDDQKYYLLLDEVQFMSRFEEVLNSLLRISNIDVYVTGSNAKFLSSDIVTEFRGRGDEIRIYPLSFAEFYAAYDGDYDDFGYFFCHGFALLAEKINGNGTDGGGDAKKIQAFSTCQYSRSTGVARPKMETLTRSLPFSGSISSMVPSWLWNGPSHTRTGSPTANSTLGRAATASASNRGRRSSTSRLRMGRRTVAVGCRLVL